MSGEVGKADKLYRTILNAQPGHAEANYNVGVLSVGLGNLEQALPHFVVAMEAYAGVEQFWVNYINTLISLDRIDKARIVLDQAKEMGFKGELFDGFDLSIQQSQSDGYKPPDMDPPQNRL